MKFRCEEGHLIELEFPDEYFSSPLIVPCPKCNLRYEIIKIKGKTNVKPYKHSDPLRFISMHY
ncbi:Uncharacterised protein [uncultured archaeon]|nr:Uncharacterised protein [uncultured archaeon]